MKTTCSLVLNLLNTIPSHIQTYIHPEALTIALNSVISNIIVYNKSLISTEFQEVFAHICSKCMYNWTISISTPPTEVMKLLNKNKKKRLTNKLHVSKNVTFFYLFAVCSLLASPNKILNFIQQIYVALAYKVHMYIAHT